MKHQASSASHSQMVMMARQAAEQVVAARLPALVEQTLIHSYSYSGPLPPAEETRTYEEIHPGFTGRWITMAEEEQKARLLTVQRRDQYEFTYRMTAIVGAWLLAAGLIGAGVWLISIGKEIGGFVSIGVAIASVLSSVLKTGKAKGEKTAQP